MSRTQDPKNLENTKFSSEKKSKKPGTEDRDDLLVTLVGIILPAPNKKKGKRGEERYVTAEKRH